MPGGAVTAGQKGAGKLANIRKQEGKRGITYKITVTSGADCRGKQIRHYKTWKPDKGMTARQMEREAQRVAVEFERAIELGYQADNRQTFAEYVEYFIDLEERRGAAPRTISLYRYFMERIGPTFGHMKLQDIRPQHLNAFYKTLEEPGARSGGDKAKPKVEIKKLLHEMGLSQAAVCRGTGISPNLIQRLCRGEWLCLKHAGQVSEFLGKPMRELFKVEHGPARLSTGTVRRFHGFLSTVFSQAEREMLIPYNPAQKATPPQRERIDSPEYFQPDELERILEAADEEPIDKRALIYFLAVSGCRIGEALGLRWDKINFETREVKIDCALHYLPERGAFDGPTKTKNTRYIILPAEVVAILRKARAAQNELRLLNGDRWKNGGYVFTISDGSPIVPNSVNGWFDRFSARHGLPHIHPHQFRHTAASIMIANGVDIVTVSKMLGHANTSMTTDVYSHMIEDSKRKAAECIADSILKKRA